MFFVSSSLRRYAVGGAAVPAADAAALAAAVAALSDEGWPPVCVFLSDLSWAVVDRLWEHAENLLGAPAAGRGHCAYVAPRHVIT